METGILSLRQAPSAQDTLGDYGYLAEIVRIGFPVTASRAYLNRHLGNPVTVRLVELQRGETASCVREIEVQPHAGGPPIWVRADRRLPDGSPANYFSPPDLVSIRASVHSEGDVPPLRTKDVIVLHVPVRSYLRFLPGIYQSSSPVQGGGATQVTDKSAESGQTPSTLGCGDEFLRFILLFQHLMTTVTDEIDGLPSITDPLRAEPSFLRWIASWVNFDLDESLPLHQQRELVRRSIRLHRTRGTREGITEMVRVLTSAPVTIQERTKPYPAVLGAMTLAGGPTIEDRFLRDEPVAYYVLSPTRAKTAFFVLVLESRDRFRARFGERSRAVLRRISQIVTGEKPANVTFTVRFDESVDLS